MSEIVKILLIHIGFLIRTPTKVQFAAPIPPNKPEVKAPVSNKSSMSDYHRFAQTILSMALVEGFDVNFVVRVEQVADSSSDGPQE